MSSPYGYGVRPQDRPLGPPPGVLPPPQSAPWPPQRPYSTGPSPMQQRAPYPGQQYPGQWAQPYYGGPGQFNGFQPPRRRGGAARVIVLAFVLLMFLAVSVAVLGSLLGKSDDNTARPGVTGPSIVPTPTSNPQKGTAEDYLLNADIYRTGPLAEQNCPAANLREGILAAQKVYYQKLFN